MSSIQKAANVDLFKHIYSFTMWLFCALVLADLYPVQPFSCGANINSHLYDATEMRTKQRPIKITDSAGEFDYYIQFCDDLDGSTLNFSIPHQFGATGIRVKRATNEMESIGWHDSQNYQLFDLSNPNNGFMITSNCQSFGKLSNHKWFYISQILKCKADSESVEPVSTSIYDGFDEMVVISVTYENKWGCGKDTTDPPVQPTYHCNQTYKSHLVYPMGIEIELNELNMEPFGFPVPIDNDRFALVKTCGYSTCPYDMECNAERAGIWVCERPNKCRSFGELPGEIGLLYDDPDEGLKTTYTVSANEHTQMSISCDFGLQIEKAYVTEVNLKQELELDLVIKSENACSKELSGGQVRSCQAKLSDPSSRELSVDLTQFNKENGWKFNVSISSWGLKSNETWLYWQPCGPLTCPGDLCPDSTGASVWLCRLEPDGDTFCQDYGLFSNSVAISPFSYIDLRQGVSLNYDGTGHRDSHIRISCDESLPPKTIVISESVGVMTGDALSIFGYSSDFCVDEPSPMPTGTYVPTPTPEPTPTMGVWSPPDPVPAYTPAPPEWVSRFAYIRNATHSSRVDMSKYYAGDEAMMITDGRDAGPFATYVSPFSKQHCPKGYNCEILAKADGWHCWGSNCWPAILSEYAMTSEKLPGDTTSLNGISVRHKGVYGVETVLNLRCGGEYAIALDDLAKWSETDIFTLSGTLLSACPKEEITPPIPTPAPGPTPAPKDPSMVYDDSRRDIHFDLSTLSTISQDVVIEGETNRQSVTIHASFSGAIECPGNICEGPDTAFVFKCWNNAGTNKCFAVGDPRYGITLNYTDAVFDGGYGGFTSSFSLKCGTRSYIDEYATEPDGRTLYMTLYSPMFCFSSATISGGSVFMMIILLGFICYVSFGIVINFILEGSIEFPNSDFWDSVVSSIRYVFRRRPEMAYDAI